jgi:hypothetical protein
MNRLFSTDEEHGSGWILYHQLSDVLDSLTKHAMRLLEIDNVTPFLSPKMPSAPQIDQNSYGQRVKEH